MTTPLPRIQIYHYCPRCGSDGFSIRQSHLTVCENCSLRLYHNPCAAAGAILVDSSNRVLLVRREHEPAKGMLAFPGGYIDDGESAEEALRRELVEEIGIEVSGFSYVCTHPNSYAYDGVVYPNLDIFYQARVPHFEGARPLDEVAELVTLPIDEVSVDDLAFASTQAAWIAFRKLPNLRPL